LRSREQGNGLSVPERQGRTPITANEDFFHRQFARTQTGKKLSKGLV
jgi:hypothetical protein